MIHKNKNDTVVITNSTTNMNTVDSNNGLNYHVSIIVLRASSLRLPSEIPRWGGLDSRNLFSHGLGVGSLRTGCQCGWVLLGTLFLAC